MQFARANRKSSRFVREKTQNPYPFAVQFYKNPPLDTITLEEFEKLALERLQVLRIIERAGTKYNKNSHEYRDAVIGELRNLKLSQYYKITMTNENFDEKIFDERRKDHISHFILRLAYCRREDLRRWFVTQEVDLFRIRFVSEKSENKKAIMAYNNLNYEPIDEKERNSKIDNLILGSYNSATKIKNTNFYKVPFIEVLDLIGERSVYLEKGYAYIPENNLVSIVVSAYRTHLSHALAITSRALPQLEEDGRLINMLNTLHQRYVGIDYSKKVNYNGEVVPEAIDSLAPTSFPLCMQVLHETLRKNHHLKYNGRLQYGLFLKGIGMSLEDALRFWRQEFTKIMDMDKFDKQYAYNIRYNYGKEGKRANFSPYSCMKIIMSNAPGPGESHGCPFKHSDKSHLKQKLNSFQLPSSGISEILDLVSKGHYQIACTRLFELKHKDATVVQGINHPNQYFEESQKIIKGLKKEEKRPSQITTTRAVVHLPETESVQPTASSSSLCDEMEDFPMEDIEELLKGIQT